ncbi:hypothetical protein [Halococcus saccharolyticus]|uniref:Uncharacterized protein n=1 Tax=Halococcus saccharolyticus DSM 5350 TaxID=1227455 RepID=M0MQH3_9EURY|nr:hypothetical protein [Halococcus saccharolyticus]EMA47972.1 hypothetical protein C449_00830 [Halococcus saccharolyticus DSM 5350]
MTEEYALNQGNDLADDDPENQSSRHTLRGCLKLHDYETTVEYLSTQKVQIKLECPKCPDRRLHYGNWRFDDDDE